MKNIINIAAGAGAIAGGGASSLQAFVVFDM